MNDADPGAQERWAAVERASRDVTDHGIAGAVRTYYLVYLPAGLVLLAVVGGVLAARIFALGPADWPEYIGAGLSLAAIGEFIGGMLYFRARVSPLVRPRRRSPWALLTGPERAQVRREILGKEEPSGHRLPPLRGLATQLRPGLALQLLLAPGYLLLCANQILLAISRWGQPGFLWVWIPLLLLFAGLVAAAAWQFRRTGDFLRRTAGSTVPTSPDKEAPDAGLPGDGLPGSIR